MQIYNHIEQLKLLKDRYFIDEFSRVSLKIFVYGFEFIIALLENPIEFMTKESLEGRLELIMNVIRVLSILFIKIENEKMDFIFTIP